MVAVFKFLVVYPSTMTLQQLLQWHHIHSWVHWPLYMWNPLVVYRPI